MDMMELRRNIIMGSSLSLKEYTATGNPLTFLTDLARPLKSCLATWLPHQSGTGDPSPENVRPVLGMDGVNAWHCGTNLFDGEMELGGISASTGQNDAATDRIRSKNYIPIPKVNKLFLSCGHETTYLRVFYYTENKTFISVSAWGVGNREFATNDAAYIRIVEAYSTQYNNDIAVNYPLTETDYSPYHGTSYSVAFPATGKNLVPPFVTAEKTSTGLIMTPQSDGSVRVHGKSTSQEYALISRIFLSEGQYALKAGTYTFRINTDGQGSNLYTQVVLSNGTVFFSDKYGETKTIPDCYISRVDIGVAPSAYNIDLDETISPQLEAGSTPTAYEPYTAIIYGGSLDLTTGMLTAEWWSFALKWKDKWYGQQLTNVERRVFELPSGISVHTSEYYNTNKSEVMCNRATWKWSFSEDSIHFYIGVDQGKNVALVFQPIGTDEDTEIHICGTLAEPQTFQLSPTQITALIGNNTMWADSDSLEIKYLKKR